MRKYCLSYNDVINYLEGCAPAELCASEHKVAENLELAQELIESITDTRFCPYEDCKTFNGQGSCYLFWNFANSEELTELDAVLINGVALAPEEYEFSSFRLKKTNGNFDCCDKITVCGIWGNCMPRNIKKAIILLALEYTQPGYTSLQQTDTGVDKVLWSDFSIEYSDPKTETITTGYREIDSLIASFIPTINSINFTSITNQCPKKCCRSGCKCQ